jgi:hypothetical protein
MSYNIDWVHPSVYSTITDNSSSYVTATGTTKLFVVFTSEKGIDNKIQLITTASEFEFYYGTPDIKKYGQSLYQIINWLTAGGAVYCLRVLPEDAGYSNAIVNIQTKTNEKEVYDVDGNLVIVPDVTIKTCVTYTNVSNSDSTTLANMLDTVTGTKTIDNYVNNLLFAVIPIGRGSGYNDLGFKISLSTQYDDTYDFRLYNFEVTKVTDTGSIKTIQGPFLVSFDSDALSLSGESLYIKSVLDRYCDYFTVVVSENTYEKLGAIINDKVNPNEIDFFTGTSRTIENDSYATFYCEETQQDEDIHMSLIKYQNGYPTSEKNFIDPEDEIEISIVDIDNNYRTSIYNRYANAFNRMKLALSRFKKASLTSGSTPIVAVTALMKETNLATKFAKQEVVVSNGSKVVYNWYSYDTTNDYRDSALFGTTVKVVKYYKNNSSEEPYYPVLDENNNPVEDKTATTTYKDYCNYTGNTIDLYVKESDITDGKYKTTDGEEYTVDTTNAYDKYILTVFLTGAYGKLDNSIDVLENIDITPVITVNVEQSLSTFIDFDGNKYLYTDGSYIPLKNIIVDKDLNPIYDSNGNIAVSVKEDSILTNSMDDGNIYASSLVYSDDDEYIANNINEYTLSDEALIAKKFLALLNSTPSILTSNVTGAQVTDLIDELNKLISDTESEPTDIENKLNELYDAVKTRNDSTNYKVFDTFKLQEKIAEDYLDKIINNTYVTNSKSENSSDATSNKHYDNVKNASDEAKTSLSTATTISEINNIIDTFNAVVNDNFGNNINTTLEYINVAMKIEYTDASQADTSLLNTEFNTSLVKEIESLYNAAKTGSTTYELTTRQKLNNLIALINENYLSDYNTAYTSDMAQLNSLLLEYNLYITISEIESAITSNTSEATYETYLSKLEYALINYYTLYKEINNITLPSLAYYTAKTISDVIYDEDTYTITELTYDGTTYSSKVSSKSTDTSDSSSEETSTPSSTSDESEDVKVTESQKATSSPLNDAYDLIIKESETVISANTDTENIINEATRDIDLTYLSSSIERINGDAVMSDNFVGKTYLIYDEDTEAYTTLYQLAYLSMTIDDDVTYNCYANKNTITLEDQITICNQNVNNLQKLINTRLDDIYELYDYTRISGTNVTKLSLISSLESIESYLLINEKNQIKFASLINQIINLETERYSVILDNVNSEMLEFVESTISESTDIIEILETSLSEFTDTEISILNEIQSRNSTSEAVLAAVTYSLNSYNARRTALTKYLNQLKTQLNVFIAYCDLINNNYSIEEDKELISICVKSLKDFLANLKFGCKLVLVKMSAELLLNTSSELKSATQITLQLAGELSENTSITSDQIESIISVFNNTLNVKKQLVYSNNLQNYDNNVALIYGTDGSIEGLVYNNSEVERLISKGYKGLIDDELSDKNKYPIDLVLDANYSASVKNSLITLVTSIRDDFMAILDTGITGSAEEAISYRKQHINASTFRVAIFAQDFTVNDTDYTNKVMKVTAPYFLSSKIPANDEENGIYTNFVGPRRGIITGFESISYNPNPEWKEQMYNNRVNYIETDLVSTRFNCNLTSQYTTTALSNINNVRAILRLQREVEDLMKDYIFEWNDDTTISQAQQALDGLITTWQSYRVIKSLEGTVYSSDYDKQQKLLNVSIEISFTDLIERIHIDITVNN